jgi:hypothetical protein
MGTYLCSLASESMRAAAESTARHDSEISSASTCMVPDVGCWNRLPAHARELRSAMQGGGPPRCLSPDVAGRLQLEAAVKGLEEGEASAAGLLAAVAGDPCWSAPWTSMARALCALAEGNTARPCRCICDGRHDSCA